MLFRSFSAGPNADPAKVIAILNACAKQHKDVLRDPQPLAVFEGYSTTATEYSLRVLLSDIHKGLNVQSDLRIAVFEALRSAKVDLPGAQTSTAAAEQHA